MMYRHFGGDVFFFQWNVVSEQMRFGLCAQVQNVEFCLVFVGQIDGLLGGFVTRFFASYQRVAFGWHRFAIFFPKQVFIFLHYLFFFGVDGDNRFAVGK